MRLRSITLTGFKTFARQTEIAFDPGITAIVGPNGSGKSNTVDAFRWVLGESQARDLRGRRMEEVIYAGGQRRPRAPWAEVTITIDNSDHRLPLDYEEVAIRRRLDRSGQSDYFLNGTRVRRRDLLALLASTGLTTDGYAIVDQRDIESIIGSTPEQRRLLLETAAQVRGVKARRAEAASQLEELARNLGRLEDLRSEIAPRLEALRAQAAAAREATEARRRLELLRGSIAWEEWRQARDAHRRSASQLQALERRLAEALQVAEAAEASFRSLRGELQAAQDRRLARQREVASKRLELQQAEHELALALERVGAAAELARAARSEEEELSSRRSAAAARRAELSAELERSEAALAALPPRPPEPEAGDPERARRAQEAARLARQAVTEALAALGSAGARRRALEESLADLRSQVENAEAALPEAEAKAQRASRAAAAAQEAAARLGRLRAELEGVEALFPRPAGGLRRVGDLIVAEPGYEAALSAALGPLVDAWAAPDAQAALAAAAAGLEQVTVVYPTPSATLSGGSLYEHVRCEPGWEGLARSLLGGVVVGREVTLEGIFHQPGLVRSGSDPRVALAARRHRLLEELSRLEPEAREAAEKQRESRLAAARLEELRAAAAQRRRLQRASLELKAAWSTEEREQARLSELERAAAAAEAEAAALIGWLQERDRLWAEHRAEVHRLELERQRWQERVQDLRRQLQAAEADLASLERAAAGRSRRATEAERRGAELKATLPRLREAVAVARRQLEEVEREEPGEEAELAESARRLVAAEEARVDARLRASTLEGQVGLLRRELELAAARMEELRARMPEGLAPEQVPGGRAREREIHQLERRLEEIGPTNPLAEAECAELELRYGNLLRQLDDIEAARADLEDLVVRLRGEEESRYEAVFGAVAANFQEYFRELTAGGKAALRHVPGPEGPRSGVELLVQPPRKRMQSVSLLSTGERALTALALVLAVQEVNPAPFTILDEVDAALDDANVARFGEVLQRLARSRQLLVITHNHLTMTAASALYGVHLDESGCSHLVSVRLEEVQPPGATGLEAMPARAAG